MQSLAIQAINTVIQNKVEFFDTDDKKYVYLDTFINEELDIPVKVTHFTVLDMDGDKVPEVVLELTPNNFPEYYEVLHYMNGKIYGYNIVYRGLEMLKMDGTYWSSGGADDNRCNKMRFSSNSYEEDILGYSESRDGTDGRTISYFIKSKPVIAKSFNSFIKEQNDKKDVVWYEPSNNNIEKELSNK